MLTEALRGQYEQIAQDGSGRRTGLIPVSFGGNTFEAHPPPRPRTAIGRRAWRKRKDPQGPIPTINRDTAVATEMTIAAEIAASAGFLLTEGMLREAATRLSSSKSSGPTKGKTVYVTRPVQDS